MSDGGHVCQEGCGILAQNIGNSTLTHNEIGHFRYTGVSTGWTWGYGHTVVHDIITSFNHIHHIGEGFLSDMGCVYTLGHQPGSQILNNYCSDVQSYNYGGWAYYTDEGSRDELFQNNGKSRACFLLFPVPMPKLTRHRLQSRRAPSVRDITSTTARTTTSSTTSTIT